MGLGMRLEMRNGTATGIYSQSQSHYQSCFKYKIGNGTGNRNRTGNGKGTENGIGNGTCIRTRIGNGTGKGAIL